jgi:hypothetical protein
MAHHRAPGLFVAACAAGNALGDDGLAALAAALARPAGSHVHALDLGANQLSAGGLKVRGVSRYAGFSRYAVCADYSVQGTRAAILSVIVVQCSASSCSACFVDGSSCSCCNRNLHALVHVQRHPQNISRMEAYLNLPC